MSQQPPQWPQQPQWQPSQQQLYPPYQQQAPQPPPKKKRRGAIGCAIAIAIIVIALVGYAASNSGNQTATTTGGTTATAASTQAPAVWTTTHTYTGNGSKKTEVISVPGDWKILYRCSFQNIGGVTADGVLTVSVYNSDGSLADPIAVNATCKNGVAHTTGETEEHQAGQIYLSVDGTGDWTITVQEPK